MWHEIEIEIWNAEIKAELSQLQESSFSNLFCLFQWCVSRQHQTDSFEQIKIYLAN